jgi:hypothetical protein
MAALLLAATPAWLTGAEPAKDKLAKSAAKPSSAAEKNWHAPRTPDGQPDLQGVWTNSSRVPLERPKELGAREFYTEQEAAENIKKGLRGDRPKSYAVVQYDLSQYGLETGQDKVAPSLRTSLIIGPEGSIPPFTPAAEQRVAEKAAYNKQHAFDGPENRSLSERCILWPDEGPPMLPGGYNSNLEIVQGAGYVTILHETIHDVRVIPLNGRPHLPPTVRQWRGDPRGHWEGETLVIDTTNFTEKNPFHGSTEKLHVSERLTRTAPDLISYKFTVEDPDTWIRPWSGEVMMTTIDSPIFEYACQEGNYGMPDILKGARAQEKKAAASHK